MEGDLRASLGVIIMEHRIESVMTAKVVTATPATPFRELVGLLERHRISALPVVDDAGRLVGIVSEADLLVKEGYPHGGDDAGMIDALRHRRRFVKAVGTCAADVMTRRVVTVPLGTQVAIAARLMVRLGVKRLPVVDDQGKLAGIVTRSDLLKVFLRPDPAVLWEVRHDLLKERMGAVARDVSVEVRGGVVTLTGQMERRSHIAPMVREVQAVDGVVSVNAKLAWRIDDDTPMAAWPIA
jgi:CBS domain-containing protein